MYPVSHLRATRIVKNTLVDLKKVNVGMALKYFVQFSTRNSKKLDLYIITAGDESYAEVLLLESESLTEASL